MDVRVSVTCLACALSFRLSPLGFSQNEVRVDRVLRPKKKVWIEVLVRVPRKPKSCSGAKQGRDSWGLLGHTPDSCRLADRKEEP